MKAKLRNMNLNIALILFAMGVDFYAIYQMGLDSNYAFGTAIMTGIICAIMLDVGPFMLSAFGIAILFDKSTDKEQKKKAKATALFHIAYIVIVFMPLIYTRIIQLQQAMSDPEYNGLFVSIILSVIPILTTILTTILGIFAHVPNKDFAKIKYESDNETYQQAKHRYEAARNGIRDEFSVIESETGIDGLMDAVESGGKGTSKFLESLNLTALGEIPERNTLDLQNLYHVFNESLNEVLLLLATRSPGSLDSYQHDIVFETKSNTLQEPSDSFGSMVEGHIQSYRLRHS